ncbi:phosphoserine phosphatase SerB [Acidipropionibacterium timonense]|uniref:phosphoserine phosphatase SerB n=1 Tax=Acidipropionibacterium timonense TaxID=2161818 RepID=UPI001031C499
MSPSSTRLVLVTASPRDWTTVLPRLSATTTIPVAGPGWSALVVDHDGTLDPTALRATLPAADPVDLIVVPDALRRPGLLVSDVDSTMVRTEGIDLLADCAGRASEVAEVTARAMAGELDFTDSLRQRVACLAGLPEGAVAEAERAVVLTDGATELVDAAHAAGWRVALVSGGFTQMVAPLADRLHVDAHAANTLEILDGHLTGRVVGPVVDRRAKAAHLRSWAERFGVDLAATIALGDGANDLDMIATAGLGVAFHAKQVVVDAAPAALSLPHLDALATVFLPRTPVTGAAQVRAASHRAG